MSRYTKKQRERLDQIAHQQRDRYRSYLRGTQGVCPIVGTKKAWWRATPQRWAWLNEELTEFLTLPQLRRDTKKKGISTQRVYWKESPKHSDWPGNPRKYYRDEWISWRDLFGKKNPKFLTLPQLKREVAKEEICSAMMYQKEYPKHSGWPSSPYKYYIKWVSYQDLFGKKARKAA
jgi:hypothetical protein